MQNKRFTCHAYGVREWYRYVCERKFKHQCLACKIYETGYGGEPPRYPVPAIIYGEMINVARDQTND